ncbi:MAG: aminopeptidase P family N-terminal domain-containing protein [Armatimonadetes bacterium]|nr:aminopeptidase P family N-terminal domain-containing protein [Armatimonadota bacterium]
MSAGTVLKLDRVRTCMEQRGLGTLVLSRLDNVFWLTGGSDCHVGLASEQAVCSLVVTAEQVTVVTSNIEAPRLRDEELSALGWPLREVRWHDQSIASVVAELSDRHGRIGGDTPAAQRELVDLAPQRYSLLSDEVEAYRRLGRDMGELLGTVARELGRGESELRLAGRMSQAMLERGITPTVLLVAADERITAYRHPLPTARCVDKLAMLVAGGRRGGLIVSLSRLVHFGPLPAPLSAKHKAVCEVDGTFIAHTLPGARVAAIFAAGVEAYRRVGYPDEWEYHHQGGATGYAGRDYRATPDSQETVQPWQAFAWNPSIAGTKSEDSMLATPEGPEVVSATPDWPLLAVSAAGRRIARPAIMVR